MYKFRAFEPAKDKAFVYSTWLRGMYYANSFYGAIDKKVFFDNYAKVIDVLLANNTVLICCDIEDNSVILGYSVLNDKALHFVYVKAAFRKKGIATKLANNATVCTHITPVGDAIRLKHDMTFNPFLI